MNCICVCGHLFITRLDNIKQDIKTKCRHNIKSNQFIAKLKTKQRYSLNKDSLITREYLRRRTPEGRFTKAKHHAKLNGLSWAIEKEDFYWLCTIPCFYCTDFFESINTGSHLDRIDSTKGYLLQNVVSCCRICNRMKSNVLTLEEMKAAMDAVLNIRKKGQ